MACSTDSWSLISGYEGTYNYPCPPRVISLFSFAPWDTKAFQATSSSDPTLFSRNWWLLLLPLKLLICYIIDVGPDTTGISVLCACYLSDRRAVSWLVFTPFPLLSESFWRWDAKRESLSDGMSSFGFTGRLKASVIFSLSVDCL